ncbi:MAG TPA: hypothetical protein VFS19_07360, partial [Planctomycetota bacterium]|nr:hypothetical protein [Planctomycetota bacterium]
QQDQGRGRRLGLLTGRDAIVGFGDGQAAGLQGFLDESADTGVVIRNENGTRGGTRHREKV